MTEFVVRYGLLNGKEGKVKVKAQTPQIALAKLSSSKRSTGGGVDWSYIVK